MIVIPKDFNQLVADFQEFYRRELPKLNFESDDSLSSRINQGIGTHGESWSYRRNIDNKHVILEYILDYDLQRRIEDLPDEPIKVKFKIFIEE
jgi:hypothetical protein